MTHADCVVGWRNLSDRACSAIALSRSSAVGGPKGIVEPYSWSPSRGCPREAAWTRIWCVRPVSGLISSHEPCGVWPMTRYCRIASKRRARRQRRFPLSVRLGAFARNRANRLRPVRRCRPRTPSKPSRSAAARTAAKSAGPREASLPTGARPRQADRAGAAGRDTAVGCRRNCCNRGSHNLDPPAMPHAQFHRIILPRRLRGQAAGFVDRQQAIVVEKYFQTQGLHAGDSST